MELKVNCASRSYPIIFGSGIAEKLPSRLKEMFPKSKFGLVTNTTMYGIYGKQIREWEKKLGFTIHVMSDGERYKTIATWSKIFDTFFKAKFERSSILIAFGGGVVGDLTGFAAATMLRGIQYVQVPTTLLAMVDSSVGGKTGVNWVCPSMPAAGSHIRPLGGKNLIGAFHQPGLVWIDTAFLNTLPKREFYSGSAELFKYAFIGGREMFDFVSNNTRKLLKKNDRVLLEGIRRSIAIKARIVEQDEREISGKRMLLNFGHTFAHALEKYFGFGKMLHGEAVWWGMLCACELGKTLKTIPKSDVAVYDTLLAAMPRPRLPSLPSANEIYDAMFFDKKVVGGKISFVMPAKAGTSVVRSGVRAEVVKRVVKKVLVG
ncbi:MAG: 3-dehydroquinate synthase [Chitinispirillaceae bacterium]|jgi:3-dehydroquinate synthase